MVDKLSGSCICGLVKYQISGDVKSVVNCHCNLCRKMNGSAFSTYAAIADNDFKLLGGDLKTHPVTEHAQKNFCAECGTPIYNTNPKYAGIKILHLGSIDDPSNIEPQVNIYCESRLDWLNSLPPLADLEKGIGRPLRPVE